MATDGPDPTPCDPEVFKTGNLVMTTHTIPSNAMENWVRLVAKKSEQKVDWHFAGGRACVLALGDLPRVRAAIQELMPEHDYLQRKAVEKRGDFYRSDFTPSCTLYGEGECNPMHMLIQQNNADKDE